MRMNNKMNYATNSVNQLFNVSFHDFLAKESDMTYMELASEFGISLHDVKKLKKHMDRS
ncbi:hypothetical protein P6P90_04020 [Ectobacillus antri]|uniref:RNA polymerase subunit sigma-70 n=1 Tax=Ectobacillus antri TaxID=2486280 RepID=A0ABT6H187_9BACI|nr:hypothetical protein [Ectobacillus antri]MDG4655407.1 hypothetical protein [Ectobacillus antri]MDG5753165.1 hypothetical protein [Ectobacillus antri]